MAVLLETSKGDIVIDLLVDESPLACKNFLKLCKIKYYNNCLFHNVQQNFIAQTGDPTGTGKGGSSIYGILYGDQARFFQDEVRPTRRHTQRGTVGMASAGPDLNASQFYITLAEKVDSLDDKHTIFGLVTEGQDVLSLLNDAFVDDDGRPLQNVRLRHTIVLDDPFEDPDRLAEHVPAASPPPAFEQGDRLEDDWVPVEDTRPEEEVAAEARRHEASNRAVVLEMVGDLPVADAQPPPDMLFVCKLNPVTTEEDLEIIFSRFGRVTSCDVIRDWKTGDSLCYAFIGFDSEQACEDAYFKMNNVLIDDRRIKVDFSQSVYHLWRQFRRRGGKGDAALAQEADTHERAARGLPGNLQLSAPRGHTAGPGAHHLLLDHLTEETAVPTTHDHKRPRHERERSVHSPQPHKSHRERQPTHRSEYGADSRRAGCEAQASSRRQGEGAHYHSVHTYSSDPVYKMESPDKLEPTHKHKHKEKHKHKHNHKDAHSQGHAEVGRHAKRHTAPRHVA